MQVSAFNSARERFRELDTEALINLWSRDGRESWAEELLKWELLSRGISKEDLEAYAFRRREVAQLEKSLQDKEDMGSTMAPGILFVGTVLSIAANIGIGETAAIIAAITSGIAYEFVMIRYLIHLLSINRNPINFSTLIAIRKIVLIGGLIGFGIHLLAR